MSRTASTDIVTAAFAAVERRNEHRLAELYHPEVEFHWPPACPTADPSRGRRPASRRQDRLRPDLGPLSANQAQRLMDPRVVAGTDQEAVVLRHQPRRPVNAGRTSQQAARQDLFPGPNGPNRCVSLVAAVHER
jgi:ketosteroid isomerase-like protein